MLVDYPREWRKYIIEWSDRRFRKDTPIEIIEKAKKINKRASLKTPYTNPSKSGIIRV